MKKTIFTRKLPFVLAMGMAFGACDGKKGDDHTHVFDQKGRAAEYLKDGATCQHASEYYYSCACGEKGDEWYAYGGTISHHFTKKEVKDDALRFPASCVSAAKYYHSCSMCGAVGGSVFTHGEPDPDKHDFTEKNTNAQFLKSEPTETDAAQYYYSCADCGKKGEEWFSYGEPLRQYSPEEKIPYSPVSLTVTLYDAENSVYGFTYHTAQKPLRPVLKIAEGDSLDGELQMIDGEIKAESAYGKDVNSKNVSHKIYVVKIKAQLKKNTKYTYQVYDKYVKVGSEVATLTTKDTSSTSFTFAHVSDSQSSANSGANFRRVLTELSGKADFVVHTGDVVQYAMYEYEWDEMLHKSFSLLSAMPMMAVSGNHETGGYYGNTRETTKHFYYKVSESCKEQTGVYYTFVYGNVRFIMLDTNDLSGNRLSVDQYAWLESVLKANDSVWTVVGMHNPLYSVGKWGLDPSRNGVALGLRSQLGGLFYDYGVDIVLQGHDHCISKTYPLDGSGYADSDCVATDIDGVTYAQNPDGVYYLMNGPAGDQNRTPYASEKPAEYEYAVSGNQKSWAEFTVDGNKLTVSVKYYDTSVKTYYTWGIVKTA